MQMQFDRQGNLFFTDQGEGVRRVDAVTGIITRVAGDPNATTTYSTGDGGPATSANIYNPLGLALDGVGGFYVSDLYNNNVRHIDST